MERENRCFLVLNWTTGRRRELSIEDAALPGKKHGDAKYAKGMALQKKKERGRSGRENID